MSLKIMFRIYLGSIAMLTLIVGVSSLISFCGEGDTTLIQKLIACMSGVTMYGGMIIIVRGMWVA